jgi:hypothetical protein
VKRWLATAASSLLLALPASGGPEPDPGLDAPAACQLKRKDATHDSLIVRLQEVPGYFAKVTADGKYMSYSTDRNHLLDLENGGSPIPIPGAFDAVPTPPDAEGRSLVTVPLPDGMTFYSISSLVGNDADRTHQHIDPGNDESYQSVGIRRDSAGQSTYRMLSGKGSLTEYRMNPPSTLSATKGVRPCKGKGPLQLPMISKDGGLASFFDSGTGSTKIFKLDAAGNCSEALDLGFPTGKLEFSYDGSRVAFHVDSALSTRSDGRTFLQPFGLKNIYTLDLEESGGVLRAGELRKLTNNTDSNTASYYPSFSADGQVYYMHLERGPGSQPRFSFRKVDPRPLPKSSVLVDPTACEDPLTVRRQAGAVYALADLWRQICSRAAALGFDGSDVSNLKESAFWTLGIEPAACREMVETRWKRGEGLSPEGLQSASILSGLAHDELRALSLEAMLAACPTASPAAGAAPRVLEIPGQPRNPRKAFEIFQTHCVACHSPRSGRALNWELLSISNLESMLKHVRDDRSMPPGRNPQDPVMAEELAPLIEELEQRLHQAQEAKY